MRAGQWLADVAGAVIPSTAEVVRVDRPAPSFVRVGLRADSFERVDWTPGSKLQFRPTSAKLTLRCYTPTRWDRDTGETELIGYTHGDGPGSSWFSSVQVGDSVQSLAPRRSLDLGSASAMLFVGDESSLGLALALGQVTTQARHLFEATDSDSLAAAVTAVGLPGDPTILRKTEDRADLLAAARTAAATLPTPYTLVVSGDAATLHRLRRDLRTWPHRPERTAGKAYWAAGRTGLD